MFNYCKISKVGKARPCPPLIACAIGIFDGVHRGHQRVLKRLTSAARENNAESLVITFHPHPREVLVPGSKVPLLISLEHRLKLIKDSGIDYLIVIRFTKSLSRMNPDRFIKEALIDKFKIEILVVGENFTFGHMKKGDPSFLKKASKRYGFRLFNVRPVKSKGRDISSTRIRHAIEKGDLRNASRMLGRPVTVLGTVVKGRRIGRRLGFPTANIDPHHEIVPPIGVYAVDVRMNKKIYRGILNIGTRPSFRKDIEPIIELHIFNFKKYIYGKNLEIIFKRKIRNERQFRSREALRRQIQKDILRAR